MHDLNHWFMLNRVERLRKIQLQDTTLTPRRVTLMNELKGPRQAVLDRPPLEKTILITMNNFKNNFL